MQIWHNTAITAAQSPVIGIGVQSTRFQAPAAGADKALATGTGRAPLGWHAHNFFLQTWLELGAGGALLLLGVLLAGVGAIGRLGAQAMPYGAALFATIVAIGATGWGLWQPWLLGTFAAGVICLGLLDRVERT